MAILAEIAATRAVTWKDTSGVVWKTTADVEWVSQDETSTLRLSLDGQALDHYWDAFIESFSAPSFETAKPYGGFVEMTYGTVTFSPDAFVDNWDPPEICNIAIYYTASTEAAKTKVFQGDIRLQSFDELSVVYKLYPRKYTEKLLDLVTDYDGNTVPCPKAFGAVTHVYPLRVEDHVVGDASYPQYHLGGLGTSSDARSIQSFSSSDSGNKTKVVVDANHGWSNGTSITINGTINFNGTHTIESASGDEFVIDVDFPTDDSERLPITANAFTSGGFAVYEEGVPIQENVRINGDNFYLTNKVQNSRITISGTASQTDLEGVMTWGQSRLGTVYSIDTSVQRATSPAISYWADKQRPLIDFLSEISAFFTHYFYIDEGVLYLGDMLLDNGTQTLDEYDYFTASYGTQNAVSQISCEWVTRQFFEGYDDDDSPYAGLKDTTNQAIESQNTLSTGTATSTKTDYLVDSGATFITDGIEVGHVVQNTDDSTSARVLSVSETQIHLSQDIFTSGEAYSVGPEFPYARPMNLEPYHNTKSDVSTALQNILTVISKRVAEITIPMSDTLPVPGEKYTFTDTQTVVDTTTWIRARSLQYDFANEEIRIKGEGVIS